VSVRLPDRGQAAMLTGGARRAGRRRACGQIATARAEPSHERANSLLTDVSHKLICQPPPTITCRIAAKRLRRDAGATGHNARGRGTGERRATGGGSGGDQGSAPAGSRPCG